jgi:GH25 family lysozyme M1 (1,4-beta-N-acetylmuramidase)
MQPINPSWTRGIDASQWQGNIDFSALSKSGEVFVISRALYGLTKDSMFEKYYPATKAAGLIRGAYQFGRPKVNTPEQSVKAFADTVNVAGGFDGFPPILDFEYGSDTDGLTPAQLTDWVLAWMAVIKSLTGMSGMLYTSTAFISERLVSGRLAGIPLWDAQYDSAKLPSVVSYLHLKIWQYAAEQNQVAKIPGVPIYNQVDEDVFIGTKEELIAWLEVMKGVQKTTANVNGKDFAAVVEGDDTYILWTELETLPGFTKQYVNGKWYFKVSAPMPVTSSNVQAGISKIQEGLKLLQG